MTSVKDYVSLPRKVSVTLVYDQKALYTSLKKWFADRRYIVIEKDYTEKITAGGKRVFAFLWEPERRVDDYTKDVVVVEFKAEVENVQVETYEGKKKTVQSGTVLAIFSGYLIKDIESEWHMLKERPFQAVIREAYDKMVRKGKWARYKSRLEKDLTAVVAEFKAYLKVHRYD